MPKLQRAKTVACGLLRWDRCCIIVVSHWSKPAGKNMASLLVVVGFRTSHSMPKEESHVIFSKNLPLKAGGRGNGALLGIEGVTMNTPGQRPGVFAVLDEHGAVHHGIGDALRALANAPAVVGEVMHDVFRQRLHRSGIKNGEISGHARTYQPAIINAKGRGRDEGNLAYGL